MLAAGVAGCATTQVATSSGAVKAPSVIVDQALTTPRDDAARLVVTRDTGFAGGGCLFEVLADGKLAAVLKPGEQVSLYVDPGECIVGVQLKGGLCPKENAEIAVQSTAGATKNIRAGVTQNLDLRLQQTAF
jgi:hypothetical protein